MSELPRPYISRIKKCFYKIFEVFVNTLFDKVIQKDHKSYENKSSCEIGSHLFSRFQIFSAAKSLRHYQTINPSSDKWIVDPFVLGTTINI